MSEETSRQDADHRLLSEVGQGNLAAFGTLYDRLSGPLYGLCLRMTGGTDLAEDILQEAFVMIWRKAATHDPARSSVFGWAVHLTRCTAIDHLRCRGRRLRVDGEDGDGSGSLPEPAARERTTSDASVGAENTERAARLRGVLDKLPAEQRRVIEMAFFSDLSHHEISARLALPLGTVKNHIRRGLLKLRDNLKRMVNGGCEPRLCWRK